MKSPPIKFNPVGKKIFLTVFLLATLLTAVFFFSTRSNNQPLRIISNQKNNQYAYRVVGQKQQIKNTYFGNKNISANKPGFVIDDNTAQLSIYYQPDKPLSNNPQTSLLSPNSKEIIFHEIRPATDLKYIPIESGVKEEIVLNDSSALDSLTTNPNFNFSLDFSGMTYETDELGNIIPIFTDKNKQFTYSIPPAFMQDATGAKSYDLALVLTAPEDKSENHFQLILTPKLEWLQDPARQYPVVIDPTVVKGAVPISYWPVDEGYGSTTHDSSTNANVLTVTNATWQTTGAGSNNEVGKVILRFDGSGDFLTRAYDSDFNFGANSFSISLWARIPHVAAGTDVILARYADAGFKIYLDSNESLCFGTDDDATWGPDDFACSPATYNDSEWHHIEAVKNGTTSIILYVDGTMVKTNAATTEDSSLSGSSPTLYLGVDSDGTSNAFQGDIDSVSIFNYARDENQIKADAYQRPQTTSYFGGPSVDALTNGLIGYWKMDEANWTDDCSTATVTDHSGNNYHGLSCASGSGLTTPSVGKFSNAANLDKVDDFIELPNNTTLENLTDSSFSIGAWVNYDTLPTSWGDKDMAIVGKNGYHNGLYVSTTGTIYAQVWNSTDTLFSASSTTTYNTEQWLYVNMVVDDQRKKVQVFVNGLLQGETPYSGTLKDNANPIRFGRAQTTGTCSDSYNNCFDGKIDEVRIYSRALSPEEVLALFEFAPASIAHWQLDENNGTIANDISGNGNTATLTNSPTWSNGQYGSGLSFDGSQQYLSIADSANLRLSGDFTIAGWVKPLSVTKDYLLMNNNVPLIQKISRDDGYELGITQDGIAYGMLTNISKTWTRYDNGSSADCSFTESNDDGCVFTLSATNNWDDYHVYTPFVFKDGSTYKMYYGGHDGTNVRVGLATSTNGYTWTRNSGNNCGTSGDGCVLSKGSSGEWNAGHSYFPHVIKDNGTYKMWMGGSDGVANVRIGYATSTDGTNWTFYGSNNCSGTTGNGCVFNIGTASNWDEKFVSAPSVIKDGSTYKMWYLGRNAANVERIGYATSADGTTWTRYAGNSCSGTTGDGCVMDIGGANTWYSAIVTAPKVIKDGNLYHMLFSAIKTGDDHYRLGYATSTDGITWTKYDNTSSADCGFSESYDEGCILNSGATNSWDDRYTQYSTFFKDGPSLKIWYSGIRVGGNYRIGYATFTPGISDTVALSNDTYHYLSFNKSGTNLNLFVDGVLKATGTTAVTTIANTSALLAGYSLYGSLDSLMIYNYARSQDQVTQDMNAGHPAPGSPVGSAYVWYKFNEGYDNTAHNSGSGGSGLDGSITNSTWSNSGKLGRALTLTASSSVTATITDPGYTNSVSIWIYPTTSAASKKIVTDTKLTTDSSSRPTYGSCIGTALNLSTWTHIVAVSNGSGSCAIYQNGVLTATGSTGVTFGATVNIGDSSYIGSVDEFKFYPNALTADQVKAEFNLGKSQILGSVSTASDGTTGDSSANRAYCPPGNTEGNCAAGQNPAPVAEWQLNENSGTEANDISGNGLIGYLTNFPSNPWQLGKHGSSVIFGGITGSDYISVADPGTDSMLDFGTGETITISAWINPEALPAVGVYQTVVTKGATDGTNDANYTLSVGNSFTNNGMYVISYCFTRGGSWSCYENNTNIVVPYVWQQIEAVITFGNDVSGGSVKLYHNGNLLSGAVTGGSIQGVPDQTNKALWIGAVNLPGGESVEEEFAGLIDGVRIYNYARTPAQIAWEFNQGAPVAWWKFNECQGTDIHSSNEIYNSALNGTWSGSGGGTQTSLGDCETTGTAWYNGQSGKNNGSLNFDGSDDYVNIGDLEIFDFDVGESFSLSAWINRSTFDTNDVIVAKHNTAGTGIEDGFIMYISPADNFRLTVGYGGGTVAIPSSSTLINSSGWYHLTAVVDHTAGTSKLYVNGNLDKTYTNSSTSGPDNTLSLVVGAESDGGSPFSGKIDDVRIYNYALSEEQIQTIFNGGSIRYN